MGLTPLMLFAATLLVVRNQRILAAWHVWQKENERRAAVGLPPNRSRSRRAFRRRSPRVMPLLPLFTRRPLWLRLGHQARTIAPGGRPASTATRTPGASQASSYYYVNMVSTET